MAANEESIIGHEQLVSALKAALTYDGPDRPALVARIPVICNDIRDLKIAVANMEKMTIKQTGDIKWLKWLGGAFASAAGLLALKAIGIA